MPLFHDPPRGNYFKLLLFSHGLNEHDFTICISISLFFGLSLLVEGLSPSVSKVFRVCWPVRSANFSCFLFSDFDSLMLVGIPWDMLVSAKGILDGIEIAMGWICSSN